MPDAPLTGVPRRLQLPGGAVIETDDFDAVARAWPARAGLARLGDVLERRWTATLACGALAATTLWLVIAYALPLAADPIARSIGPDVETAIGRHALASIDRLYAKPSRLDREERAHVQQLLEDFMAGEDDVSPWRLQFRRMGGPNAFALPGNTIVVTDELVRFAKTDDELLAVLAHEVGHLRERHATRLVLQQSGVAVLATALAGDAVGMTFLAAAIPALLARRAIFARIRGGGRRRRDRAARASRPLAAGVRRRDAALRQRSAHVGAERSAVPLHQHAPRDRGAHPPGRGGRGGVRALERRERVDDDLRVQHLGQQQRRLARKVERVHGDGVAPERGERRGDARDRGASSRRAARDVARGERVAHRRRCSARRRLFTWQVTHHAAVKSTNTGRPAA